MFDGLINAQIAESQINRLQQIARGFRGISGPCLVLLRLELRCHTLMYLVPAIRKSNYELVNPEQAEADQQVLVLCRDISSVNELLSASLDPSKMEFLFHGLAAFMSEVLIHSIRYIKAYNELGVQRMRSGIFKLQATLSGITKKRQFSLDKATKYYDLLKERPFIILEGLYANGAVYSEEEYRALFKLMAAQDAARGWQDESTEVLKSLADVFHTLC